MYGNQYAEFYDKFFIQPLMRGKNRQVIGAIWSTQSPPTGVGSASRC